MVHSSVVWDEGRPGFPGCLRSSIALLKGEEFPTLFILVGRCTCHHVVSIECYLFCSHLPKFVSLFRRG